MHTSNVPMCQFAANDKPCWGRNTPVRSPGTAQKKGAWQGDWNNQFLMFSDTLAEITPTQFPVSKRRSSCPFWPIRLSVLLNQIEPGQWHTFKDDAKGHQPQRPQNGPLCAIRLNIGKVIHFEWSFYAEANFVFQNIARPGPFSKEKTCFSK